MLDLSIILLILQANPNLRLYMSGPWEYRIEEPTTYLADINKV